MGGGNVGSGLRTNKLDSQIESGFDCKSRPTRLLKWTCANEERGEVRFVGSN